MDKTAEFRSHAQQCRAMAHSVQGEQRDQFLTMASQWDALASQRAELLERHPDLNAETPPPSPDAPAK